MISIFGTADKDAGDVIYDRAITQCKLATKIAQKLRISLDRSDTRFVEGSKGGTSPSKDKDADTDHIQ